MSFYICSRCERDIDNQFTPEPNRRHATIVNGNLVCNKCLTELKRLHKIARQEEAEKVRYIGSEKIEQTAHGALITRLVSHNPTLQNATMEQSIRNAVEDEIAIEEATRSQDTSGIETIDQNENEVSSLSEFIKIDGDNDVIPNAIANDDGAADRDAPDGEKKKRFGIF